MKQQYCNIGKLNYYYTLKKAQLILNILSRVLLKLKQYNKKLWYS